MTQELVAQHMGVSRQAVSKWESGKMIACEHILLSDIYAQDFAAATFGTVAAFRTWALHNVTGIVDGLTVAGSMRAKVSPWLPDTSDPRFNVAPASFRCYVMDTGYDAAHGQDYQRIMFFEQNGKVSVKKSAAHSSWL